MVGHDGEMLNPAELQRGPEGLVPSSRELAALLRAIRDGDLDALRRLYDGTGTLVFGLLRTALRDQDRAAEATERCFLWVWRTAPTLDPGHPCALTFLLRAVRQELEDHPQGP